MYEMREHTAESIIHTAGNAISKWDSLTEKQPRGDTNAEVAEQQYEADIVIVILVLTKRGF